MDFIKNKSDYNRYLNALGRDKAFNNDRTEKYWKYIPIDVNYLFGLYKIYKPNMKLLDLGAGAGNILRFSKNVGFDVTGVEFNKEYEKYLKKYNYLIKNIVDLDDNYYKDFDVIYSFKPLKGEFKDYINLVISKMEIGTYILTPEFKIKNDKIEIIDKFLYKKIK